MKVATGNRHGHRDATMILVAYRHGLRVSELVDLRWDQVDFRTATLHVRRVKQGTPSTHPIVGDELRALRRLQREQAPKSPLRVHLRAGGSVQQRWLCADDRTGGNRMPAGTPSPTEGTIRGRFKRISVTGISSTRCDILSYRRLGSRISGENEP